MGGYLLFGVLWRNVGDILRLPAGLFAPTGADWPIVGRGLQLTGDSFVIAGAESVGGEILRITVGLLAIAGAACPVPVRGETLGVTSSITALTGAGRPVGGQTLRDPRDDFAMIRPVSGEGLEVTVGRD